MQQRRVELEGELASAVHDQASESDDDDEDEGRGGRSRGGMAARDRSDEGMEQ